MVKYLVDWNYDIVVFKVKVKKSGHGWSIIDKEIQYGSYSDKLYIPDWLSDSHIRDFNKTRLVNKKKDAYLLLAKIYRDKEEYHNELAISYRGNVKRFINLAKEENND